MTKATSKDTSRQETIQPIFPNDHEIIRELDKSGEASYYHPNSGDEVYTYDYDLYSQLSSIMSRLQAMVDILGDDDRNGFGFIFESLIRDATNQLEEIFKHIEDTIGHIELDIVGRNSSIYRIGMIVGARVKPTKEAAEATE